MRIGSCVLHDFKTLSEKEILLVLEWRNKQNVRKWMYNSSIIKKQEHFEFIRKLSFNDTKKYFLISSGDEFVGVVYFTNINLKKEQAELGIYSNPDLIGKGNLLLKIICDYAFFELKLNKLIAEVDVDNSKAIDLYNRFNFKILENLKVNQKQYYIMELYKNDYR